MFSSVKIPRLFLAVDADSGKLVCEVGESTFLGAASRYNAIMKTYRYFDAILALFVAVLLISNVSSSAKIVDFGFALYGFPLVFDAGTLLFPLSYIFGDVLTEVYGYSRSRKVIWLGFGATALLSLYIALLSKLPGDAFWMDYAGEEAFMAILGGVASGGIVIASLTAYFLGEFSNSFVLAKMKIWSKGKNLWMRTIGSTLIGEGIDTLVFMLIATLFHVFPWELFVSLVLANYIFKVLIEVLFTPITYAIVAYLKRVEREDFYDTKTDFNPFHLQKK